MYGKDITPFVKGHGTHIDADTTMVTYGLSDEVAGWKMAEVSINETGYFLYIKMVREKCE